jgi:hypothetical protein
MEKEIIFDFEDYPEREAEIKTSTVDEWEKHGFDMLIWCSECIGNKAGPTPK